LEDTNFPKHNLLSKLKENETMIFRFLFNTYKEYLFISAYKLLVYNYEKKILDILDVIQGKIIVDKKL
jgi:hypothetical protein